MDGEYAGFGVNFIHYILNDGKLFVGGELDIFCNHFIIGRAINLPIQIDSPNICFFSAFSQLLRLF